MKFFLAVIVTAAFLSEIIPVWAADPDTSERLKRAVPSIQTETTTNPNPPAEKGKPIIKKIKPPVPKELPLRIVSANDFYYYAYNGNAYYSLSLPKDFGSDPLFGLPASGPMLMRSKTDITMMTFIATDSNVTKATVFENALKNRTQIPLPPLGPNEEYEYIPAPRYEYHTDTAPLKLPEQIIDAKIVDASSGRTTEGLPIQYLYLSCNIENQHCMVVLSRSERGQKAFEGLFIFPYAQKHNYIPLATYTAQSLRTKK